jgi:hypothetical protein
MMEEQGLATNIRWVLRSDARVVCDENHVAQALLNLVSLGGRERKAGKNFVDLGGNKTRVIMGLVARVASFSALHGLFARR